MQNPKLLNTTVVLAALGYFVDLYDLVLFGMERVASLTEILTKTLPPDELINIKQHITTSGAMLLNWQMLGMLLGGIFWGILGDKKGRLSVLFGSIITYSVANVLNGFVNDVPTYAFFRFISGFGLAGELGAGITLVNEMFDKNKRGIGTTLVASVGLFGAVVAGITTLLIDDWRMSYFIGGGLGFALLFLRIGVMESGMYANINKQQHINKGNFLMLFSNKIHFLKYIKIILIAIPVWFVMLFFVQFSPEMASYLGVINPPKEARIPIMIAYIGITLGDVASGLLSQQLRSRKKVLLLFIALTLLFTLGYYAFAAQSLVVFYTFIFLVGFATGYWAVFMSSASELFGTNIRSTVTTTAPNMVRGSVTIMALAFTYLKPQFDFILSITIIGIVVFGLAFWAASTIDETYGKDLNYTE
jgi:predicted MFS family arabinose efflux permease